MIIVGVDPGTRDNCAVVVYDSDDLEILHNKVYGYDHSDVDRRIKGICDKLRPVFETLTGRDEPFIVSIEFFVMQGKAGQMLHRLIGGILTLIPENAHIEHVQNTTVKLYIGGSGKAEKIDVANGLLQRFKHNKESLETIKSLIQRQEYDILDAAAIALTGEHLWLSKEVRAKKAKKK